MMLVVDNEYVKRTSTKALRWKDYIAVFPLFSRLLIDGNV